MSASDGSTVAPCPGCGATCGAGESFGETGHCGACDALRDAAANVALAGMLAAETSDREATIIVSAKFAYEYADAMLRARRATPKS